MGMRQTDLRSEASLHVLCVTVLLDPVTGGGTAERTVQLASHFAAKGDAVTVLTTDIGLTEERRRAIPGAEIVGLKCLLRRFFVVEPRLALIAALVRRSDIVHLMGHWNILNVLAYVFARWYRVPYVICPAGELKLYWRSLLLKRIFNWLVGASIIRHAAGWIAVTEGEFPDFRSNGIDPSRVRVLPNGVDVDGLTRLPRTDVLARLGVGSKGYVLFMGRLNPIKGPDLLLAAFASVARDNPSLHLVLAGPDGGLQEMLIEETVRLGLEERVHLAGYVSGSDKATLYKDALFLAIPSRHEAMSIVVLEAGAVGVPVLLTDQCGFDQVGDVDGGLVVAADEASIGAGIQDMLRRRCDLEQMGRNLNRLIVENYSWDIIGKLHGDYFRSILRERQACSQTKYF